MTKTPDTEFNVVVPARYASSRLPGKPLMDIAGKPMLQRVYEQACKSGAALVVIATDHDEIRDRAVAWGAEVCMTRTDHPSGTDRLTEVAVQLGWSDEAIVVNVQGDEPLIPPAVINQVARNLAQHHNADMATLSAPISDVDTFMDPNTVKVVSDLSGYALYFSRAAIPWPREAFRQTPQTLPKDFCASRHIGLYAYRTGFLRQYVTWPPTSLETSECLEQLRALAHGCRIHVDIACDTVPGGVDTVDDLEKIRRLLSQ